MKWLTAAITAAIVSVLIIVSIFVFNSFMERQVNIWMESESALGILPRFAVSLSGFFRRYIFFIVPLVIFSSFAVSFAAAGNKKRTGG